MRTVKRSIQTRLPGMSKHSCISITVFCAARRFTCMKTAHSMCLTTDSARQQLSYGNISQLSITLCLQYYLPSSSVFVISPVSGLAFSCFLIKNRDGPFESLVLNNIRCIFDKRDLSAKEERSQCVKAVKQITKTRNTFFSV